MAAKKFLGLGFTFAATDKGLEKKLSSISKLVDGINSSLGDISKNAGRAEDAMNGFAKAGGGGGRKRKSKGSAKSADVMNKLAVRGSRDVTPFQGKSRGLPAPKKENDFMNASYRVVEDVSEAVKKSSGGSNSDAVVKELQRIRKIIVNKKFGGGAGGIGGKSGPSVGPKSEGFDEKKFRERSESMSKGFGSKFTGEAFKKDAESKSKKWRAEGKSFYQMMKDMESMASEYEKASKASDKLVGNIYKVMNYTKQWGSNVLGSLGNLMSSLGIDIQTIFPKEIRAFAGVLGSLMKPLKDGAMAMGKFALGKVVGMFGDKKSKSVLDQLRKEGKISAKANKETATNLGGSTTNTIFDKLSEIAGNTTQKGKNFLGGILDKLKGWMIPLGLAAWGLMKKFGTFKGILGLAEKAFGGLKSAIGFVFNLFKNLGSNLLRLIPSWQTLVNVGRFLVEGLTNLARFAWEVVAPIAVLGTALAGFATGLWGYKDEILGFFKELGSLGLNLTKWMFSSLANAFAPVAGFLMAKFGFILNPLIGALSSAGKFIYDAVTAVGNPLKMLGDLITKVFKMIYEGWKGIGSLIGEGFSFGKNMLKMFNTEVKASTSSNMASARTTYKESVSANTVGSQVKDYRDLIQSNEISSKNNEIVSKQNDLLTEQNYLMKQMVDAQLANNQKGVKVEVKASRGFDAITRGAEARTAGLRGSL